MIAPSLESMLRINLSKIQPMLSKNVLSHPPKILTKIDGGDKGGENTAGKNFSKN
jgi:hypothetical protein